MNIDWKSWPAGRNIVGTRVLTETEMGHEGWGYDTFRRAVPVLVLDDGSIIYPASDAEGNHSGEFFVRYPNGREGILEVREITGD